MRKYWKPLLTAAFGVALLTACEDVPAPYNIPTENGNSSTSEDYAFLQAFETGLGECVTSSEAGSLEWEYSSSYKCALITGYKDFGTGTKTNQSGTTWLVSPEIDLTGIDSAYVNVNHAINYAKTTLAEDHKLYISTNYVDSLGVAAATWTDLQMSTDGMGNSFTFQNSRVQLDQSYMGQKIRLALKHIAHDSYSSTWEVKSLGVVKGSVPPPPTLDDLVGSGTADDPYDVASTIRLIAAGPPSTNIYTKGIVVSVDASSFDPQYGSLIYYISDDGTSANQLEVYRGYGLNGDQFTSANALKQGDRVVVYGQVVYFNNKTMEFTQGSQLYSLNPIEGDTIAAVKNGDQTVTFAGFSTDKFLLVNAYTDSTTTSTQLRIVSMTVTYEDTTSETITMADLGLSNGADLSNHTLGTLNLTFDKGTGSAASKYMTAGGGVATVNSNNSMLIEAAKAMTSIVITAQAPGSKAYNGNTELYGIASK